MRLVKKYLYLGLIMSITLPTQAQISLQDSEKISVSDLIVLNIPILEKKIQFKPEDFYLGQNYQFALINLKYLPQGIPHYETLLAADKLYLSGDTHLAANLYRQAKKPFPGETTPDAATIPEAIYEEQFLPPGGQVYWRLYQEGKVQNLESKILISLQLLVENYPEFIPGHIHYAQALDNYDRSAESFDVLQAAVSLYPAEADLVTAKIEAAGKIENWLGASLTARRFALFNSEHIRSQEFSQLAAEYLEAYRGDLKSQLALGAVGNILTGALGYYFLGNLGAPISAVETTFLLIQGENAVGDRFASQLRQQLPLLEDEETLAYINQIGSKLVAVAGRDDLDYQFYLVRDENLNAFALPGGKIFINAGAILKTDSEAELAGLLAHEISHAALSHGFQLVTQGNLTANVTQFIPYGGTAANLLVFNYSRQMEREADLYGTKILAASGYAADGLHELMLSLDAETDQPHPPAWLSTHPETAKRAKYIEISIIQNQFNRYAYQGVSRHRQIRERVAELMAAEETELD